MPPFPSEQYVALRSGRGLVELADWSSLRVTGADRQVFLHNFCTNDVKRLVPGTSCEAFFTNVKGKIVGHGLVTCRDDELVVITVPNQAVRLREHLDRYVIREDVQLRDSTSELAYLLLAGDRAVDAVCDWVPACAERSAERPRSHWPFVLSGVAARLIPCDVLGLQFAYLLESASVASTGIANLLAEREFVRCGWEAWNVCRVEAGTPLLGIDFDDRCFPQEVGRDEQAIRFTKGCYLGQETIARIDALGHVNQRIVGVQFAGTELPVAGTELFHAGVSAGRVTSAVVSPRLGTPLALAMVRREANASGTRLESSCGDSRVISLPLS